MYISKVEDERISFYHEYVTEGKASIECYPKNDKKNVILFFPSGKVFLGTALGTEAISNNEVVVIPKNTFARISSEENKGYELFCLSFSSNILEGCNEPIQETEGVKHIHCFDKKGLLDLFKRMEFYSLHLREEKRSNAIQIFLKELVYFLQLHKAPLPLYDDKEYPAILIEVLHYINENLCAIKNVTEISSMLYISYSYLVKLFKKYLKTSPKKYLTEQRLFLARKLIEQGEKPTSVYEICGFESYSIFYRCYLSRFGYSPSKQILQKNDEDDIKGDTLKED